MHALASEYSRITTAIQPSDMHSFKLINNMKLANHYYMYHPSGGSREKHHRSKKSWKAKQPPPPFPLAQGLDLPLHPQL